MRDFIIGAAVAGGILFAFVSNTWIVVIIFWAIIAFLSYIKSSIESEDNDNDRTMFR